MKFFPARLITGAALQALALAACPPAPGDDAGAAVSDADPDARACLDVPRFDLGSESGCVGDPDSGRDSGAPDLPGEDLRIADAASDSALDTAPGLDSAAMDHPAPDLVEEDAAGGPCPACMVLIQDRFCIDRFEASRADATSTSQGVDEGVPSCRAGVLPWHSTGLTPERAAQACQAAGKRLCTLQEWPAACAGPAATAYSYGATYDPLVCNGIDTYCRCGEDSVCAAVEPCPYPHCYNRAPPSGTPAGGCGADRRAMPTGSFAGCTNPWGIFDMNGNVWEAVAATDGLKHYRGGAYNCVDTESLHRCDYDATWGPTALGFRCCSDPR